MREGEGGAGGGGGARAGDERCVLALVVLVAPRRTERRRRKEEEEEGFSRSLFSANTLLVHIFPLPRVVVTTRERETQSVSGVVKAMCRSPNLEPFFVLF